MVLHENIHYQGDQLYCDDIRAEEIAAMCGTPVYVYSLQRILSNYRRIRAAFSSLKTHIHYSVKANGNLALLHALIDIGAGIDAVSGGEIHRALTAGAAPESIVFAGVGKTSDELRYAVEQGIGWFNVENTDELALLNRLGSEHGRAIRVALRLNPNVTASTHPSIATGHGNAKFGLSADTVSATLAHQADYPYLEFSGIHVHIGSQLENTTATRQAVEKALSLILPYPHIRTVNIGGGLPVTYHPDATACPYEEFASLLAPLLDGYEVLLEPGRSIVADAGMLLVRVLYVKKQAGKTLVIVDGSMTELMRPALYGAYHEIVPVSQGSDEVQKVTIAGPVCETTDMLACDRPLPAVQPDDLLAILTTGAYGMVMANNYNARPRPAEVMVEGDHWRVVRQRETWDDLMRGQSY